MDLFEIFGYFGALLIGVVLGLIGGGGSILTVPILVYLLAINPMTATAYSLFVVGTSSLFGAIQNFKKGLVDVKTALVFATPAFVAVYLTRRYLMPALPDTFFTVGDFVMTKNIAIMVFFALYGVWILHYLNILLTTFHLAGGIILLLVALDMLANKQQTRREQGNDAISTDDELPFSDWRRRFWLDLLPLHR